MRPARPHQGLRARHQTTDDIAAFRGLLNTAMVGAALPRAGREVLIVSSGLMTMRAPEATKAPGRPAFPPESSDVMLRPTRLQTGPTE